MNSDTKEISNEETQDQANNPLAESVEQTPTQPLSPEQGVAPDSAEESKTAPQSETSENLKPSQILSQKFGYHYDAEGVLKNVSTGEGFKFVDQKHYEALGDVILEYIFEQLEDHYNLDRIPIPFDSDDPSEAKSFVFASKDFTSNTERCVLMIHGAGAVRAGQWARSVCINDNINRGTVFPAVETAISAGYSVLIANPNYNSDPVTKVKIPQNGSPDAHVRYLWQRFIRDCPAEQIYLIAHSMGGSCATYLMEAFKQEFISRVKAIAFTDSVHGAMRHMPREYIEFMAKCAVDWVASDKPRDTLVRSVRDAYNGCVNVSAGHTKHEYTTGYAFPSIFPFFEKVREGVNPYL